jgi:biopolymer transport protein ExbD
MAGGKKRSREFSGFDITPLIDVVFLLLIFFMVSSVFKKDELALLLSLPKTEQAEGEEQKQAEIIIIELNSEEFAYNGKKMSVENIDNELKAISNKSIPIELRIDKDVRYERLVLVLDKLKNYELSNLSLITAQ